MYENNNVLGDSQGDIRLLATWGSDEFIVETARVSTGKGFLGWGPVCSDCGLGKISGALCQNGCGRSEKSGDEKLLRYMYENAHSTPFEFGGAVFEIEAPIMVFREWHRHRTQSYSEMSARYVPLPDYNYIPTTNRLISGAEAAKKSSNKQAQPSVETFSSITFDTDCNEEQKQLWAVTQQNRLREIYAYAQTVYRDLLDSGAPKELARLPVPVARFSRMRAQANLRNWIAFLTLRDAPNAQWEIRRFAECVLEALKEVFPRTIDLYIGSK